MSCVNESGSISIWKYISASVLSDDRCLQFVHQTIQHVNKPTPLHVLLPLFISLTTFKVPSNWKIGTNQLQPYYYYTHGHNKTHTHQRNIHAQIRLIQQYHTITHVHVQPHAETQTHKHTKTTTKTTEKIKYVNIRFLEFRLPIDDV